MSILQVNAVKKIYTTRFGGNRVQALSNVTFQVEEGEYVAIMGESGSGKTTLLNILAALDKPTSGSIFLDGKDLSKIKESDMARFSTRSSGICLPGFQSSGHLLPGGQHLSAAGTLRKKAGPDERTAGPDRISARYYLHFEKIPL